MLQKKKKEAFDDYSNFITGAIKFASIPENLCNALVLCFIYYPSMGGIYQQSEDGSEIIKFKKEKFPETWLSWASSGIMQIQYSDINIYLSKPYPFLLSYLADRTNIFDKDSVLRMLGYCMVSSSDEGALGRCFQWAIAMELAIPMSPLYLKISECFRKYFKIKPDLLITSTIETFELYKRISKKVTTGHNVYCVVDIGQKGRYVDIALPLLCNVKDEMEISDKLEVVPLKCEAKTGFKNLSDMRKKSFKFYRRCIDDNDNSLNLVISYHDIFNPTEQQTYCICNSTSSEGNMVLCDSCCLWYHVECLKITLEDAKAKKFICKHCKSDKKNRPKKKRRRNTRNEDEDNEEIEKNSDEDDDQYDAELKEKKNWITLLNNILDIPHNAILQGRDQFSNCFMPFTDIMEPPENTSITNLLQKMMKHPCIKNKLNEAING